MLNNWPQSPFHPPARSTACKMRPACATQQPHGQAAALAALLRAPLPTPHHITAAAATGLHCIKAHVHHQRAHDASAARPHAQPRFIHAHNCLTQAGAPEGIQPSPVCKTPGLRRSSRHLSPSAHIAIWYMQQASPQPPAATTCRALQQRRHRRAPVCCLSGTGSSAATACAGVCCCAS